MTTWSRKVFPNLKSPGEGQYGSHGLLQYIRKKAEWWSCMQTGLSQQLVPVISSLHVVAWFIYSFNPFLLGCRVNYSRLQLHNCARLVDVGVRDKLKCYAPLTLNIKSSLNTNYLELTQWQSRSPGCTSGRTSGATATQQAVPLSTRYTNKRQVSHKIHPLATPSVQARHTAVNVCSCIIYFIRNQLSRGRIARGIFPFRNPAHRFHLQCTGLSHSMHERELACMLPHPKSSVGNETLSWCHSKSWVWAFY